jgi:translation initiation factor IF-2
MFYVLFFILDSGEVVTFIDTPGHTAFTAMRTGGAPTTENYHVGCFILDNGEAVTFIDTPGHAAFTAMRTRGATTAEIIMFYVLF